MTTESAGAVESPPDVPAGPGVELATEAPRRDLHVGEIARMVEDQFHVAFPRRLWVVGEVRRSRLTPEGDRPFELVEGDLVVPCLLTAAAAQDVDGSLARLHDAAVEDLVVNGRYLRAGGLLRYGFARHQLVFSVTALDPGATAVQLAELRSAATDIVRREGLGARQHAHTPTAAPLRIAVVGPRGDSVLSDAYRALSRSEFAVSVKIYDPPVRGGSAVDDLVTAVRRAAWEDHELLLLLRGPGRPLGLAPFDDERLVRAVAASPLPVITGLAGPDDRTVADAVAHESHGTARGAVDAVLTRLRSAADRLDVVLAAVHRTAEGARRRAQRDLEAARTAVKDSAVGAGQRAAAARAQRRRWIRAAGAALVLAFIVLALATRSRLFLIGLGVVIAGILGEQFGRGLLPSARRKVGPVTDVTFTEVIERLGRVRAALDATSSPEEVARLESEADRLAERGWIILTQRAPAPASVSASAFAEREPETETETETVLGSASPGTAGGSPYRASSSALDPGTTAPAARPAVRSASSDESSVEPVDTSAGGASTSSSPVPTADEDVTAPKAASAEGKSVRGEAPTEVLQAVGLEEESDRG